MQPYDQSDDFGFNRLLSDFQALHSGKNNGNNYYMD